jgi:hypothetical protein
MRTFLVVVADVLPDDSPEMELAELRGAFILVGRVNRDECTPHRAVLLHLSRGTNAGE